MGKDDIKHRYSLIPVPLIRTLFTSKSAYDDLLSYGVCDAAFRMFNDDVADLERASRHVIYCWYRKRDALTVKLAKVMQRLEDKGDILCVEPSCLCFDTIGNINEELVMNFYSYASTDDALRKDMLEWYRVTKALEAFRLSCSSVEFVIDAWERLAPPTGAKDAFCPISLEFIIKWRERDNGDEDKAKLALFMGIASIIGMQKKFALTTKGLIISRMFGCNTTKELDVLVDNNGTIAEAFKRFASRRIFEKLRDGLLASNHVKVVLGYGKRTIISIRYDFNSIKAELASRYRKNERFSQSRIQMKKELKELINSS